MKWSQKVQSPNTTCWKIRKRKGQLSSRPHSRQKTRFFRLLRFILVGGSSAFLRFSSFSLRCLGLMVVDKNWVDTEVSEPSVQCARVYRLKDDLNCWQYQRQIGTLPETNSKSPWKWMVEDVISSWVSAYFSGVMFVSGRVPIKLLLKAPCLHIWHSWKHCWQVMNLAEFKR